ncbi:MAG: redoxin family protein [Gemmatimonadales bacterium]
MGFPWSFAAACGLVASLGTATNASLRRPVAPRPAVPSGGTPAPELTNTSWLNADHPLRLAELRGRVVLLNFWVFTCYNCTNTVPSLVEFDRRYRDHGLTLIGIHTPEFPPYSGEHDKGNLARALAKYHISYANAQDNDRRTWDAYGIHFWPSFVLIDKRGKIRYTGYGEFHLNDDDFRTWDGRIRELLAE